MKKILLIIGLLAGLHSQSQAQGVGVDVQINPVAILFEAIQLTVEVPISSNGGIEFDLIAADDAFGLIGIGKYYMNPKIGADRFYIGGFAGTFFEDGAGIGFIAGYKWLSSQGVSFEFALGAGRGGGDIDVFPYGKLTVGYRFGKK